jgi:hypothetical protein
MLGVIIFDVWNDEYKTCGYIMVARINPVLSCLRSDGFFDFFFDPSIVVLD